MNIITLVTALFAVLALVGMVLFKIYSFFLFLFLFSACFAVWSIIAAKKEKQKEILTEND